MSDKNSLQYLCKASEVEQKWLELARHRLDEVFDRKVETIPSQLVFEKINGLLTK